MFFVIVYFKGDIIKAGNITMTTRNGMILFETTDTKATSGIRWKTVGFTITRERCLTGNSANGGFPMKLDYAVIYLKDEWKSERQTSSNIYVTFTIPESVISSALVKAGFEDLQDNDVLYLHGIFQVTHNGNNYGSKKYDLPSITKAEAWANPDDFKDRFDIKIFYKAPDEPISVQYKTAAGDIIDTNTYQENQWKKSGTKVSVKLTEEKMYNGKKYKLYKSYIRCYIDQRAISGTGLSTLKGASFSEVQNRSITQRIGGVQFVAIMKLVKEPALETENNRIVERSEPMPYGIIAADKRENHFFDVEAGIPATESLYLNIFSRNYLLGYEYENIVGEKQYQITFTKTYHLKWSEISYDKNLELTSEEKSETKTITQTVTVKREYSYWKLVQLEYYTIKDAMIHNGALPTGKLNVLPNEYIPPSLVYYHYETEKEYLKEPAYKKNITLPSETIQGVDTCPSIPSENFETDAEETIGQIQVRNDLFLFGQEKISDSVWKEKETETPVVYEKEEETGENVLYEKGIVIPKDTANANYATEGVITYQANTRLLQTSPLLLSYDIAELGKVTVHTPTVCDAYVSDEKKYNQMLSPDDSCYPLILDRTFQLTIPVTGEHLYIQGYGYRDYSKYIADREVQFPFDVYQGRKYYSAYSWISLNNDTAAFYIPIWVKEGKYNIQCRSSSISMEANAAQDKEEELANLQLDHYVATCQIPVEVSGRVFGLQITDISDYPAWYSVFRKKDSLAHTGIHYFVGKKDENGSVRTDPAFYTFPMLKGSHPMDIQTRITPTGYAFRFTIETIGEMYEEDDYVQMTPTFYYISKDGKQRKEADIYYIETMQEQRQYAFVKIGSSLDLANIKKRYLGNPYTSVPDEEFQEKMYLTGKNLNTLQDTLSPLFTFHHILLSENFRTYLGKNDSPTGTIPASVDEKRASMSKQKWYGEYYLPSQVYVVPKDFDLAGYEKKKGAFHFREDFWLKNGYIMIQFDIKTVNGGKTYLSYINEENAKQGYCNMWKLEGMDYTRTDADGVTWNLKDGDTFLYDTDKRTGLDYIVGGTH